MQSAHPNSLDMWRPAAVNTSLFTTHTHTYAHKLHISMGFQLKLEQFSSLHNPPTGQRLLELLRASLEALLSSYVWLTMSAYCSTFLIFGVVLHLKENSCFYIFTSQSSLIHPTPWMVTVDHLYPRPRQAKGESKRKGHP